MLNQHATINDIISSTLESNKTTKESMRAGGVFHVQCFDKDGNLKWEDKSHNLVVNQGLKDMNDKYFSGTTYTATWYLGLITGPGSGTTFAAGDTLASHAGWTEFTNYTVGGSAVRGTAVFAAPTSASTVTTTTATAITYTMTGSATVYGCFLVTGTGAVSTISSTAGTLYSEGNFSTAKTVTSGDTVTVTYSTTATS